MTPEEKEKAYRKMVRKQKMGLFFASSILKRRRNLVDKMKLALMQAIMPKPKPGKNFMADELCDEEPEFTVEELRAFREKR